MPRETTRTDREKDICILISVFFSVYSTRLCLGPNFLLLSLWEPPSGRTTCRSRGSCKLQPHLTKWINYFTERPPAKTTWRWTICTKSGTSWPKKPKISVDDREPARTTCSRRGSCRFWGHLTGGTGASGAIKEWLIDFCFYVLFQDTYVAPPTHRSRAGGGHGSLTYICLLIY